MMIRLCLAILFLFILNIIDFDYFYSNPLGVLFLLSIAFFVFYFLVSDIIELTERLLGIPYITITDELFSYRSGAIFREVKTFYYSDIKKISFTVWKERGIENSTFINIVVKDNALEEDDIIDTTSLDTKPEDIYNLLNQKLNDYNARTNETQE